MATSQQERAIKAALANDENSSDQQLVQYFVKEIGVSEAEARKWVAKRDYYAKGGEMGMSGKVDGPESFHKEVEKRMTEQQG